MPFYDHDDILVARFGSGDIALVPGVEEGTNHGAVSLVDHCGICMPINIPLMTDEEWHKLLEEKGIKTDLQLNTMVRLVFEKVESIDVFIWALQEARKLMTGERDE